MPPVALLRGSGSLAIVGGLLWLLTILHQWVTAPELPARFYFFAPVFFVAALLALYHAAPWRRLARAALVLSVFGAMLASIGLFGLAWFPDSLAAVPLLPGMALLGAGLGLLGIANLDDPVFPGSNAIPLAMVFVFVPGWFTESPRWLPLVFLMLFGVGWVALGIQVWRCAADGRSR